MSEAVSESTVIVGIDPGLQGAIAVLKHDQFVAVHDMPLMKDNKGKDMIDAHRVASLLRDVRPALIVIERVGNRPRVDPRTGRRVQMGATSMFNFGRGLGLVEAAARIEELAVAEVEPQVWKRRARLIDAGKDTSRLRAIDLWPAAADKLNLKKHHGRAEAMLIARFGHDQWESRESR